MDDNRRMLVSRRDCLKMAAVAPPAFLLSAPRKVPGGAHGWGYAARQPGADPTPGLDQIFAELGAAELDGVELMHSVLLHEGSVQRVRELSQRYRLPVIGTSWSANMWLGEQRPAILAEARTVISRLAGVKGRTLGVSVGDARRKKTPQEFDAQAACLREVMKICADHGVALNLHNHVYEVAGGEYDLKNTLERVPDARLGPDLGWLFRAKIDPIDFIRRYKDRITYAHLRNEKADGTWPETLAEGVIDYSAVGKALHEIGFSGTLAIELAHEKSFVPTRTYGESFQLSRQYVRRVMGY